MRKQPLLIVWAAIAVHMYWATILFIPNTAGLASTPLHGLANVFGQHPIWIGISCLIGALTALTGLLRRSKPLEWVWLLPQQFLLAWSAGASLHAMIVGHYADGVMRPITFIGPDQILTVVICIFHMMAIVWLATGRHDGAR